jgi:hypothetical protein
MASICSWAWERPRRGRSEAQAVPEGRRRNPALGLSKAEGRRHHPRRPYRGRVMVKRNQTAVHPFAPILFGAIVAAVLGIAYFVFGVGKDAFEYTVAAVVVFAIPVVLVFGIAGLVIAIRRLFRRPR